VEGRGEKEDVIGELREGMDFERLRIFNGLGWKDICGYSND
jgi:hypothetical protein